MMQILKNVWAREKKSFLGILLLNTCASLMSSFGIIMLVPMLDLLEISLDNNSSMQQLLIPFEGIPYFWRALSIIAIFVVLLVLQAIFSRFATVRQNAFLERYEQGLRKDLYEAVRHSQWETLSVKSSADFINLFTAQCRQAKLCLQWTIALIGTVVTAAIQIAIAFWISLPITLVTLIVGAVFLMLFRPFLKKSKEYGRKYLQASRKLHREVQNQLNGMKEIRAYGVEDYHSEIFDDVSRECYETCLNTTQMRVIPQLCYSIGAAVLIAIAFVYSVLILNVGTVQLILLVYIFSRLWPLFSGWQERLQNIQANVPAYEAIQTAIRELKHARKAPNNGAEKLDFTAEVAFDHVTFFYRNGNETVLNDVSFSLPCGSVTALIGPSGAGKSTTADLLLGLLQPTSGRILIDGAPLDATHLNMWRSSIGYIPQEPLILNTTVRENLLRFHPNATEEEMIAALKKSFAWSVVEKLPQGLDTVLGDKGIRLSGGERQRIVLARVLMGNPKLIVLDEATSALDYESENFIRESIRSLRGSTTVLVIAHRLATIQGADRAIVLADGAVAEQGTMQELLRNPNGYLAGMVSVE